MPLPDAPHITTTWTQVVAPIIPGEKNSWRVWALQNNLQARGYDITADGDYDKGKNTERAVRKFQEINGLTVDAIVGKFTQNKLLDKVENLFAENHPKCPPGLIDGIIMKESSGLIAPTNDFDPSPKDLGCDCGPLQFRVPGPPYNQDALKQAFSAYDSMVRAWTDPDNGLKARFEAISTRQPRMSLENRWRSVILAHNAPFLYDQMRRDGALSTPDALARWTNKPTGGHYTHQEWFYAYTTPVLEYTSLI